MSGNANLEQLIAESLIAAPLPPILGWVREAIAKLALETIAEAGYALIKGVEPGEYTARSKRLAEHLDDRYLWVLTKVEP